jgi:hypothetical protein
MGMGMERPLGDEVALSLVREWGRVWCKAS